MRRLLSITLYGLFLLILIEGGIGYAGYYFTQEQTFDYSRLKQQRRDIVSKFVSSGRIAQDLDQKPKKRRGGYKTEILHPYLGYVIDFHDDRCPGIGFCDDRMRRYQTLRDGQPFVPKAADRAIVVITGGSFAYGVSISSSDGKLEQALSTLPQFAGKEIVIYTLAAGGYKQPQQLLAMQYYLATGAQFDMVINIDGFNEVVLPAVENIPYGTHPTYPRVWHERIYRGSEDRRSKVFRGRVAYYGEQRAILADETNESIFSRSALKNLIWRFKDQSLQKRISEAEQTYLSNPNNIKRVASALATTGAQFEHENPDIIFTDLASLWRRSSEQLHATLKAQGTAYYHFLQPNQYVENSKPMNVEERKIAFLEGQGYEHPFAPSAKQGYPYLINQGQQLKASDVSFKDLTSVFKNNETILYVDACCHLNEAGYDLIIDEMVDIIQNNRF